MQDFSISIVFLYWVWPKLTRNVCTFLFGLCFTPSKKDCWKACCLCSAERFGKKLEDLRRERATLKPGLPSRHPEVTAFLERLRTAVHSAIHRTDTNCRFGNIKHIIPSFIKRLSVLRAF